MPHGRKTPGNPSHAPPAARHTLVVKGADEAVLYFGADSTFRSASADVASWEPRVQDVLAEKITEKLERAMAREYGELLAHGKFQSIFSEVSAQINRVIVDLSCTVKIFCTVQHHLNRHFSLRCTKMQHQTVRRSGNEAGSFKCFFFCIFILHTADRAVQIEFAAVQRSSHQAVHCRAAVLPPTLRLVLYTIMYSHPVSPFCHQKREADDSTSLFVFQFLSNT